MRSGSSVVSPDVAAGSSRLAARIIARLLPAVHSGHVRLVLPNGEQLDVGTRDGGSDVTITVHRWRALWRLPLSGEAGFSDGYIAGDWSTNNLFGVLDFSLRNEADGDRARERLSPFAR